MHTHQWKPREFISLLCGAAAWPPAAPAIAGRASGRLRGFRQGLEDAGFIKGENLAIEYCWAEGRQLFRQPAEPGPAPPGPPAVRGLSGQAGTA